MRVHDDPVEEDASDFSESESEDEREVGRARFVDPPANGDSVKGSTALALAAPVDAKMIARIASEYTQLRWLVDQARSEGCAYVDAVEEVGSMSESADMQ